MIVVRDREAGNIIEVVASVDEGERIIEQYEAIDKIEGIYEPNFYEIAEIQITFSN